jgi:hypothetical protein
MDSPGIILICFLTLITVFIVLSVLALIMQLIIRLFPVKEPYEDLAVYSAIASVYNKIFPGTKIKKIEEIK